MKEYLHMDDVFDLRLMDACKLSVKPSCVWSAWDDGVTPHEYAAHAINSHDELVENMNHHKAESERWEAIAIKEASRCADFMDVNKELLDVLEHVIGGIDGSDYRIVKSIIKKYKEESQSQPNALRDDVYVAGGDE